MFLTLKLRIVNNTCSTCLKVPFKSPKKQEIVEYDDNSLITKEFKGLNIQVYGTHDEPLFKANDIGNLLEIKDIRTTIREFDKDEWHTMPVTDSLGRIQETNMLTEQGLYKILMISRKPIAKHFQKWVFNVIREIRLKGKYDLQEQLKEQQQLLQAKEHELLKYKEKTYEEIEKTGHIYVIKTDGGIKVGKTKDCVSKRIKGLQTANVSDIEMLLDFPTSNADLLEKCVHYILDRYRCNSNREFFDCDINYIKSIVEVCGTVIDTLKSSYQHISNDELKDKLKCKGIDVDVEIDGTFNKTTNSEKYMDSVLEPSEVWDFFSWLDKNVEYSSDPSDYLELKVLCELYLNKSQLSTKILSKYKREVEKYIKEKFKSIPWKYDQLWLKQTEESIKRPRGWLNLRLS